jgi:hypothetical protein
MSKQISRRTILRGMGTTLALPLLEAMAPSVLLADGGRKAAPNRMAFLYVPNGKHMPDWSPLQIDADYELPWIVEPLAPFKSEMTMFSGLAQDGARAHGDGGGDHARALSSFLTGTHPHKTGGTDLRAGISVDQVAAKKVGRQTKFASLELGCEQSARSGSCDTGYSCAYSTNISWRSETTPAAKEINPRLVFERLFGAGDPNESRESRALREHHRKSILDFVLDDAKQLRGKLGKRDQQKIDEYLSSVRELEERLARVEGIIASPPDGFTKPQGIPEDYAEHIRLMCDLIALAFQADLTRVVTFVLADESSNRSYKFLDVPEGHHELSHHGGSFEKQAKIRKINRFHVEQLAYFLGKLKETQDGERSLLDNSMILYGSGIADGDRHNHDNLPVLLAGRAGGTIKTGRHVRLDRETPLNNLYLSMLDRIDSPTESLGNATGRLTDLDI